jgi:hypothetical protein
VSDWVWVCDDYYIDLDLWRREMGWTPEGFRLNADLLDRESPTWGLLEARMSAKPCGCDLEMKGGPHLCERHYKETYQSLPPIAEQWAKSVLPSDAAARKGVPITTGVLDYFPDAIAEVARVSVAGNDQHNPGQPLHWAREKSTDQADCIGRHLIERGTRDVDGQRHSAKLAWRALANLQLELEAEKAKGEK